MPMNKLSELSKPVAWPNGCNETAVNALRYLAENKRPIGGSDMYNTEHLYMIAREIERMASDPLYSQEYVSALLTALRNIYAACDTGERRGNGSQQGVAMPDWGTVDSVRALLESIDNG